ncbi:molybdopterin converting factor subunit 1 [Motiliproteus sp. SC1-56]|uniref:molybdopterin converting factor subunit 1 n=1 Tax=Motiliproteus sp. SC1-56 TaxID=2799565 RepID=UPI001A8E7B56|nr:molybdopterin converting factor subunit 1 [Motiliproteus sp. SC1-56]
MDSVDLVFFASIREQLGTDAETLELAAELNTVQALIDHLRTRGEPWASVLAAEQLLVAVNQEMAERSAVIKSGDEVAFFPPVTGG